MEENDKKTFKNYAVEDGSSIFDRHTHKNQENRQRIFRILRLTIVGVASVILAILVYRLTTFSARTAAALIGDLEQPTATATLDLSGLIVASPTPPATSTILAKAATYEVELPTLDPRATIDPNAPEPTRATGAIFFEPEPTVTPTPTMTPLPTAEFGNFNQNGDAPTLDTRGWSRDSRCASSETESDYVLCVVRLAEEPITP